MEERCNIGPGGQRMRYIIGIPLILIGLVGSFLSKSFLSQAVAFFGFLSFFQANDRVCVGLTARGVRDLGHGLEAVDDVDELAYFQRQSRRIYMKTFFATLALILVSRAYLYWRG